MHLGYAHYDDQGPPLLGETGERLALTAVPLLPLLGGNAR
jgi:hypothetical protein